MATDIFAASEQQPTPHFSLFVEDVFIKVEHMAAVLALTHTKDAMDSLDDVEVANLLGLLSTLAEDAKASIREARSATQDEPAMVAG